MSIERKQFEKDKRLGDDKLTIPEKKFLKDNHTDIVQNKESFAKSFDLNDKIFLCKGKNTPTEMFKALNNSRESVAILQAYLFDDPNQIDGALGWQTRAKIREINNETANIPTNFQNIPTKKPKKSTNEKIEVEKKYTLSKDNFNRYFKNRDFIQDQGNCWLTSDIAGIMKRPDWEGLIRSSCEIKKDENGYDVFYFKLPLGEPRAPVYQVHSLLVYSKQITDGEVFPASPLTDAEPTPNSANNMKSQGIILLQLAYLVKSTGGGEINLGSLNGIEVKDIEKAFLDLLGSENISIQKTSLENSNFNVDFKNYIQKFNASNQVITFGVNGEYNAAGAINHAVTLEKYIVENGIPYVYIFDPNYGAKKLKKLPLSEFYTICGSVTVVSKTKQYRDSASGKDIATVHDERKQNTNPINQSIESKLGKNGDKYDAYLRSKRGNIILESLNTTGIGNEYISGVQVKSYGQSSINIGYELSPVQSCYSIVYKNTLLNDYTIGSILNFKIIDESLMNQFGDGASVCQLDKTAFKEPRTTSSNETQQSLERSLTYLDYFRKLGNFINFVKSEYINKGNGDGLTPFSLNGETIVFDDDISKTKRTATKYGIIVNQF